MTYTLLFCTTKSLSFLTTNTHTEAEFAADQIMMLRSSSTPVLGSLLQPFSDCPNNNSHHQSELHKHTKISCSCSGNGGGSQDFKKSLIHPSPSLADIKGGGGGGGFRRAQSDGNLEGLGDTCLYSVDEFNIPKRASRRTSLEAIPSFSANNLWTSFEDDDDDYEGVDEDEEEIGGGFDYNPMRAENTVFEKVARNAIGYGSEGLGSQSEGKMYLASGIGVSGVDFTGRGGGGGGGRGSYRPVAFDKEGGGGVSMEEYYKRMLEENPGDPLFLRNYAEFLYKIKRDVGAAEEYYSRAILADQEDGETLSQYAILIWEVHHDRDRAANYFERALEASSQSSHIHAAYANFLWDEEEEEEEEEEENAGAGSQPFLHQGVMASATA